MEKIPIHASDVISRAAKTLIDGHLVAFPTETVYGLGADATNEKAVSRIFMVKGRPTNHPLIVHIPSTNRLDIWASEIPDYARALAGEFWPGPMTLILKRKNLAKDCVTGGQESVGLRVPAQTKVLELLNEFENLGGFGIAAPSANRFGAVSATTANAVEEELGKFLGSQDLILDAGPCEIGVESTIIDCTRIFPVVLRAGAITGGLIKKVTGIKAASQSDDRVVRTSGLLESHYAPNAKIILNSEAKPGEGFIALAEILTPIGAIRLASPSSMKDYARILYTALRLGDKYGLEKICVIEPKGGGLAIAIRDRLGKAAAGKTS